MPSAVPILHVGDSDASVAWYTRLGFEVEWEHVFAPGLPRFVSIAADGARLFLSEHEHDGGRETHVYLYVTDIDAVAARVDASAEDTPWGMREATVRDPDGNVVRIGTPLPA